MRFGYLSIYAQMHPDVHVSSELWSEPLTRPIIYASSEGSGETAH